MQVELNGLETALPIQIVGVNDIGLESGNDGMIAGNTLSWLQPVTGEDIWTAWDVVYRDVIILGPGNEQLGVFNLSTFDLSDSANYDALMNQLLQAANE